MSRASSHALKHPPVTAPSEPAGATPFPELAVAIESKRRRGRGAQSNAERPVRGRSAGRLRRWLAEPGRTAAVQDDGVARYLAQGHHPQQLARHRVRPFDQSLSRLRAWLRLLLRAADPRLSRTVARARFRIQAARQAGRAGTAREGTGRLGLRAAHDRDRHQHRSLSADRARIQNHARHSRSAGSSRPSRRHRHQIGAGDARHRYSAADGETQSGQGRDISDHARSQACAHHGAARLDAAEAAGGAAAIVGGRHSRDRDGRAGHSRR